MTTIGTPAGHLKLQCDVAILTAQERELESFLQLASDVAEDHSDTDPLFRVTLQSSGELSNRTRRTCVIMPIGGVGRVNSAIATSHLLHKVTPRWIFLVGIAGGFARKGVSLGDILVARRIVDYETQRISDDGEEFRPQIFHADMPLITASQSVTTEEWFHQVGYPPDVHPRVHFGSVLSGDKVLASEEYSSPLLHIDPNLIGVEMEGGGVAAAASRGGNIPFLMIRGVADLANSRKRDDAKIWTDHACDAAAAFTIATAIRVNDTGSNRGLHSSAHRSEDDQ